MTAPPDVYRRAALAAAIAAREALARRSGVAAAAAAAAGSLGVNPQEAASIAVELEKQIELVGPDRLTSDETLSAVAAAAANAPSVDGGAPLPAAKLQPAEPPPINTTALYRVLARLSKWDPLASVARALGGVDPERIKAELERLCSEEFVIIENEHVYVTERGHRYFEYSSLT